MAKTEVKTEVVESAFGELSKNDQNALRVEAKRVADLQAQGYVFTEWGELAAPVVVYKDGAVVKKDK